MIKNIVYLSFIFFFNDTATTEIYTTVHTLSLHDALPISSPSGEPASGCSRALITSNGTRSEEHTSELQSRTVISYAVFCLKKKRKSVGGGAVASLNVGGHPAAWTQPITTAAAAGKSSFTLFFF